MRERTILILIITALVLIGLGVAAALGLNLMPEQAASRSTVVDQLFQVMIGIATVIFLLVEGALLYAVFRFRAKEEDTGDAPAVHGNTNLEIVWTLIPAIIVVVIGIYSFRVLTTIEAPSDDEMVIEVIGRQFSWEFRYPEHNNLSSGELHLIVDRPTRFEITSEDVIHSFYIPAFRAKQDATPGQVSELVITPTELGRYPIRCAELCGAGHANMITDAIVQSQDDFQDWVANVTILPDDQVAAGRQVFEKYGCGACHSLEDVAAASTVGPALDGIADRAATRVENMDVETYLHASIVNPGDHIVEGFQDGLMPRDLGERMSAPELEAMIQYLLQQ